jgi:DNA-binding transcriptional regulator YbjK
MLGGVIWVRHRAVPSEAAAPLSPEERGRLDTLLREADC